MLRKLLESKVGPLTDDQLEQLLDLATTDIRVNNIAWGRRTSLSNVVEIAVVTWKVLQRGRVA